jgi:predicted ribosome quality control (RQC) complex YloA/Tae2 family protein
LSEIEEELEDLDQLTIIQLGDFSSTGEVPATTEKLTAKEKDKKKSKSKLKSGKQTKSTAKPAPIAKKGSTNTAPTSQKKALQGLLVLRPASTQGYKNSNSDSNSNSNSNSKSSSSDGEVSKRSSKSDRSDTEDSLQTPLPSLIVGRSSKQNDRITFEIAKEHHLWFHVQVLNIHTSSVLSFSFHA